MIDYVSLIPNDVDLSRSHPYLRLPHPRTGSPQLYLPYVSPEGKETVLEAVKLNGSKRRTWFIGDSQIDAGTVLMHVPVDPLFLVIPLVFSLIPTQTPSNRPFQPLSDLISTVSSSPMFALTPPFTSSSSAVRGGWNEDVEKLLNLKSVRRAFKLCCEKKVAPIGPPSPNSTGESSSKPASIAYYRPSMDAIVHLLRIKVDHFAAPPQWGSFDHLVRSLARDGLADESHSELAKEARLKSSIEHIAQYLPAGVLSALQSSFNFSALQEYLANRTAATLAAQMPPSKSNKEKAAAGVKRKGSATSRGVETLKKVNTSSMAKLTSFFKPKN
ncbi:ribonuclease H2, subunit B [Kockovaella imperatae]|uniref:Ribonuclease H2, subunit B n=1 Tax=Kockovaella imperatae TaxID=4999 RepID=A0A1Y1UTD7_9TREE|nr:ribonuclease H2, subunit B [Kockovaella imperatae]ORX40686.1 ribonuclease H2, subunit B [Kockovaella imperatae]